MNIIIGTPCNFWMKSNVEINLLKKTKKERRKKEEKMDPSNTAKSSKEKNYQKVQSQQWAMWSKQKLQNTETDSRKGYDNITDMDNTLSNTEKRGGRELITYK